MKDLDGNVVQPDAALSAIFNKMAKAEWMNELEGDLAVENIHHGNLYIPSDELSDPAEEIKKLEAEKKRLEGELARSEKMLSNPNFVNKAPQSKVDEEKNKQAAYQKQYDVIVNRLSVLKA